MIEKLDIQNFGCYSEFKWNLRDKGNNQVKFKRLNIIYGRNYSGKTTLSRIFRVLETGQIPKRIVLPAFKISAGTASYDESTGAIVEPLVRVYCKDYVDDHLSFLRDENGHINSFAVLGAENTAIETRIGAIEKELGSIEGKAGLRYQADQKRQEANSKLKLHKDADEALNKKLSAKANDAKIGIKHNKAYGFATYDIRRLQADIRQVREKSISAFDLADADVLVNLLSDVPMPPATANFEFQPKLALLIRNANSLLATAINPTIPIAELLESPSLQQWARDGIPLHKHKRSSCGFCGSILPADLWEKLGNHFNHQAGQFERQIGEIQNAAKNELKALDSIALPKPESLYSVMKERLLVLQAEFFTIKMEYAAKLKLLVDRLEGKRANVFGGDELAIEAYDDNAFHQCRSDVRTLVHENNEYTKSLKGRQDEARVELRLSEVAKFIQEIALQDEEAKVDQFLKDALSIKDEYVALGDKGKALVNELNALKIQLHDERRGAEQVNRYLTHLLGSRLKLDAVEVDGGTTYRFQVLRDEQPAYNLSEGECSLIAFCYFMARLKEVATVGKKPIVYIDDPISSLDSNHIFFVFSLIESELAQPIKQTGELKYSQLFVSTHNLEFLKYLKRLSRQKGHHEHFVLTKKSSTTAIELMPEYLRHYITELNFLFDEIHTCSSSANQAEMYHSFYNFGNNLRKFLEAFLFFKYPVHEGNDDNSRRIERFFGEDATAQYFIERVANEYSHIGEFIDRGAQPVDCDEVAKLARFVLGRIKASDADQYNCFLKSIDKPDPLGQPG